MTFNLLDIFLLTNVTELDRYRSHLAVIQIYLCSPDDLKALWLQCALHACIYLHLSALRDGTCRYRLHVHTRCKWGPILQFTFVILDTGCLSNVPKRQFNGAE